LSTRELIETVLEQRRFAVTGASADKSKAGNQVYKTLKAAGYRVYAVNPKADKIDGDPCYPSLDNVPDRIDCVVTVTPPVVTEEAMRLAGHLKIPYVWMQPGSESMAAFNLARSFSMQIVSGGPCIMEQIKAREPAVP
jgi:predicted CoA-binding protein